MQDKKSLIKKCKKKMVIKKEAKVINSKLKEDLKGKLQM